MNMKSLNHYTSPQHHKAAPASFPPRNSVIRRSPRWRRSPCARALAPDAPPPPPGPALGVEEPYRALDPGQLRRVMNFLGRGGPPKSDPPALRIGVIGASQVATYALIWPARRLAGVAVVGVAARDKARAEQYARTHGIPRVYGSYQALLDDPGVDAVYIGLPNGLHGQWSAAALSAGKHVLCEKPFAANQEEAGRVMSLASSRGLLCREAFHNAEHPANRHVAALLQGGAIGSLLSVEARVLIPSWAFSQDDIRFNDKLAGGTMMDAGCYCAHALRFLPGAEPSRVVGAAARGVVGDCDTGMEATVAYGGEGEGVEGGQAAGVGAALVGRVFADLRHGGLFPVTRFEAQGTSGRLSFDNFVVPFFGHSITVEHYGGGGRGRGGAPPASSRRVSVYGSGESNYYHQLRRFAEDAAALREGGGVGSPEPGVLAAMMDRDAREAVSNMALVDAIYSAAGMEPRQPTQRWW